jgi:hypothetical protein
MDESTSSHSPQELFARWVETPLAALRKIEHGDGAFAALAISLGLYERFIDSVLHDAKLPASPENFRKKASEDLKITEDVADRFWNCYRLGLMHAFHPKNYVQDAGKGDSWGWDMGEGPGYEAFPAVENRDTRLFILKLDPWKFTDHVVTRWKEHPHLMNELEEFAFGKIEPIRRDNDAQGFETTFSLPPDNYRTYSEPPSYPQATGCAPGTPGNPA